VFRPLACAPIRAGGTARIRVGCGVLGDARQAQLWTSGVGAQRLGEVRDRGCEEVEEIVGCHGWAAEDGCLALNDVEYAIVVKAVKVEQKGVGV
jgi:hypothetical protein